MSIIRQRRKNLIVSGLLGFLISALLLIGFGFFFRVQLADYLGVIPEPVIIEPERQPTIVASRPIAKGTILDDDDVTVIMVETSAKVMDHFQDTSDLIGKKTAIDIDQNMPLSIAMFIEDHLIDNDDRLYEVSFVELPYHLSAGEVVDVRIAFPTGQEYVVLSKKTVKGFERRADNVHSGLLSLALEEEEALRMSSALVDSYIADGTRVYLVKYVDPESQSAAQVTYPVNDSVLHLLQENPNVLESPEAAAILAGRSLLTLALSALYDDDNQPVHEVDMTTPILNNGQTEMSDEVVEESVSKPGAPETSKEEDSQGSSSGIGF